MNEADIEKIETLLGRYRPKGPPKSLGRRLRVSSPRRRWTSLLWPIGIAATVAIVAGLNVAAWNVMRQTAKLFPPETGLPLEMRQMLETFDDADRMKMEKYLLASLSLERRHSHTIIETLPESGEWR